ncbi:inorganic triphosphatase [Saccharobesus litoralis]|uniref:Inorganic triphosphatase n=1 Tax=Saccharobesus litoralis TaxID=2172099 RepID=A0A2S0VNF4_9ALTE|nr:CYTH domain-containing protein [Saccharobesus litoralis]AWB65736.1 inorganic triphosphatase [Saccharobesus litoralis]
MDTEIELKFFIAPFTDKNNHQVIQAIDTLLEQSAKQLQKSTKRLVNTYFDTPQQALRQLDFGLRVRTVDGQSEQTIKTAGTVVGGLHKRPEYNVDIDTQRPDLSLFPSKIWPELISPYDLQQEIKPLFTTDFTRTKWELIFADTQLELVLDLGAVEANDDKQDIREIEIELIDGDVRAIFELANLLTEQLHLRLSNDSKAARGYRLFHGKKLANHAELKAVKVERDISIEQAFINTVQHGLSYWQYHEEVYLSSHKVSSLRNMAQGINLIQHTLKLYQNLIPAKASQSIDNELAWLSQEFAWVDEACACHQLASAKGTFKKRLSNQSKVTEEFSERKKQIVEQHNPIALFYSERYSRLIINLVKWLYEKAWRCYADIDEAQLNAYLLSVADQFQQESWSELKQAMPRKQEFSADNYIDAKDSLNHGLLTGICVGGLYPDDEWRSFRGPWLDIMQGINDLYTFEILQSHLMSHNNEMDLDGRAELLDWSANKKSSLISVMEQSRRSALKVIPYWQY